MIDRQAVAEGLEAIASTMGTRLTDARIDAYYRVLSRRFSPVEWRATVMRACEECERFPVPKVLLALRPPGAFEPHRCELCEETPGFVYGSRYKGRGHLVPCPRRTDSRAGDWYADKASELGTSEQVERHSAEASGRTISRQEAERLMGRLDPEGRMFARGAAALEAQGEEVKS